MHKNQMLSFEQYFYITNDVVLPIPLPSILSQTIIEAEVEEEKATEIAQVDSDQEMKNRESVVEDTIPVDDDLIEDIENAIAEFSPIIATPASAPPDLLPQQKAVQKVENES